MQSNIAPGADAREAAEVEASGLGERQIEAEYELETRALCPHCQMAVESLNVIRLLRNRVNFTSSLPRRGHVLVCPNCHSILNGALGGLF